MAHCGVDVQVRNGGTLIGKQGSSLRTCLCLVRFAPIRFLPKRIRVEVVEENGRAQVAALFEDSFFMPKLSGMIVGKYQRQFDEWLKHLQGQVLPSDVVPDDLGIEVVKVQADRSASRSDSAENGAAPSALSALFTEEPPAEIDLEVEPKAVPQQVDDLDEALGLPSDVTSTPEDQTEPLSQPVRANSKAASSGRRGLRLPRFRFARRRREIEVSEKGLPAEVRGHISLADEAVEAESWSRALTHYDAAVQMLTDMHKEYEPPEAIAVSRLFFKRGIARLSQAQASLGSPSEAAKSISDYQIALEATRQALADYNEAIRRDADWYMGYHRRGEAHLFAARCERGSRGFRRSSEELNEAVWDLTRATQRDPTFAPALTLRAEAYSLLGNYQEAEADVEKAVSLGADETTIRKPVPPSRGTDDVAVPAPSDAIGRPEESADDAWRPEIESTDIRSRILSVTDRELPGLQVTDVGSRLDPEMSELDLATMSVDTPVASEQTEPKIVAPPEDIPVESEVNEPEIAAPPPDTPIISENIHRRRLRLPKVLSLGGQKQDEPSLSGGVGVITLTEVNLGERAYAAKNWDEAIQHFDIALSSLGDRPGPDWSHADGLARVFLQRGVARFTKAHTELDNDQKSGRFGGNDGAAIEMIQASLLDYGEAIRLDPSRPMSYSRRGEAHLFLARNHFAARKVNRALKELNDALEDLTRATERDPAFASAFAVRAVAHALLDHSQESEADVDRAVSLGADPETIRRAIKVSKSWRG